MRVLKLTIMQLELKRFQKEDYAEYASWFSDPDLNRHLGPMDQDWLEAVLSESESEGVAWAVFRGAELVAVVETIFAPQNELAGITAVATKPALRRQGIATAALQHILGLHQSQGIKEHIAYVAAGNIAGQRCLEKLGFVPVTPTPHQDGYLKFRRLEPTKS